MTYVINFLKKEEILKFVDPTANKVIHYLLKKVAFSQPEVLSSDYFSGMQITKEFLEDWMSQAFNLKKIGAGNYPIDIYKENSFGADVKFVTAKFEKDGRLKKSSSNETSLGQNFKDAGVNLDQMFEAHKYEEILESWLKIIFNKINKPIKDYKLKDIYYFIFIRGKNNIYFTIAKVNLKNLKKLKVSHSTSTSVHVENFIEPKYGKVQIYKSKKRMELRLYPHELEVSNNLITWDFKELYPDVANLREIFQNGKDKEHLSLQYKKFFY